MKKCKDQEFINFMWKAQLKKYNAHNKTDYLYKYMRRYALLTCWCFL